MEQQIKQLLQAGAMPASELLNQLNSNREKAEKVLSYLLSEEIIQLKDGITFCINRIFAIDLLTFYPTEHEKMHWQSFVFYRLYYLCPKHR